MSDYSQGPGYWQASDGKWYPPQNDAPPVGASPGQAQSPYGQAPYGQAPYGQQQQGPYGQAPYGGQQQNPYGQPQQNPYGQPPYGQPSSFGQPMFPGQGTGFPVNQSNGTSGLAIASFVLALLWLCGVGSILGVILGFVALASIRGTAKSGKGFAIAGIVIGFVSIGITIVVVTTTAVIFNHATNSVGTATERKDFTITSCGRNATSDVGSAVVTVTNHSSKPSDYWVDINFVLNGTIADTGGGIVFSTGTVEPGDSAEIDVTGDKPLTGEPTCQIGQFDRFAATNVLPNVPIPTTTG